MLDIVLQYTKHRPPADTANMLAAGMTLRTNERLAPRSEPSNTEAKGMVIRRVATTRSQEPSADVSQDRL